MNKSVKIVFWLLIAVNVIFFAVMKSGLFDAALPAQAQKPLNEEKIKLVGVPQNVAADVAPSAVAPVEPASSAPSAVKAAACFEWGDFTGKELERVTTALKKLQLGDKLATREIERGIGYWVYIAPLKDKAGVNQKIAQLKARGVTDYFVVQEAGEWLNSISLGVFKTRESAENFLNGLRAKDIRSAQVGERASKNKVTVLTINGLDADTSGKLNALQKEFAESELKPVSCH